MDPSYGDCSVCSVRDLATGKHYGAVTCYSCRAFFRRVPERKRHPRCKLQSSCSVRHDADKPCGGCRFEKCFSVGMQLELVLNEDEKKERFKSSLAKKRRAEDNPDEESVEPPSFEQDKSLEEVETRPVEPTFPRSSSSTIEITIPQRFSQTHLPTFRTSTLSHNYRPTGRVAPMQKSVTRPSCTSTSLSSSSSQEPRSTSLSSSSRFERIPAFFYSTAGHNQIALNAQYVQNAVNRQDLNTVFPPPTSSVFSPQPNIIPVSNQEDLASSRFYNMSALEPVRTHRDVAAQPVFKIPTSRPIIFYNSNTSERSKSTNNDSVTGKTNQKPDVKEPEGVSVSSPTVCGAIVEQKPRDSVLMKIENIQEEDTATDDWIEVNKDIKTQVKIEELQAEDILNQELIFRYIHKKFNTKKRDWTGTVKKLNEIEEDPLEGTSRGTDPVNRKRKSVIVKHCSVKVPLKSEQFAEEPLMINDEDIDAEDVKLVIDIPAINEMCTNYLVLEEKSHLEVIKVTFEKAWKEISHGERIMNDYINFCQTKKEFTSDFFHLANRQYRERFLNFICSLQLSEDISMTSAYNLFKENLGVAEMLIYVHAFNLSNWALELDFVLGEKDMEQWKAQDANISGMSVTMMMQFMPLLEETKMEMYTQLMDITMPIFKDRTVIILMVLITVFDNESDESVKRIKNGFLTLLKRYLKEHTKNNVDFDMQNVIKCFNTLPKFYKIFKEMGKEPEKSKHNIISCRKSIIQRC